MDTTMAEDVLEDAGLYRLMTWLSPSFPVGAYTYSHGLEWAVETGDVRDLTTLSDWLRTILLQGGGWSDAVLFCSAYRAVTAGDAAALAETAERSSAFHPGSERHLESTAQGNAFVTAVDTAWPCTSLEALTSAWAGPIAYPIAVAVAAAGHRIPMRPPLGAHVHALPLLHI